MSRVVHEVVEEALRELADESMQRELWLSDGTADVSSLTESVSRLLDDSGLGDALDSTQVVYDPDIDAQLRQLGDALVRSMARARPKRSSATRSSSGCGSSLPPCCWRCAAARVGEHDAGQGARRTMAAAAL